MNKRVLLQRVLVLLNGPAAQVACAVHMCQTGGGIVNVMSFLRFRLKLRPGNTSAGNPFTWISHVYDAKRKVFVLFNFSLKLHHECFVFFKHVMMLN